MSGPDRVPIGRLLRQLRQAAELPDGEPSDQALGQVLERVSGDVDLAVTAITMEPRPVWVTEVIGPTVGQV